MKWDARLILEAMPLNEPVVASDIHEKVPHLSPNAIGGIIGSQLSKYIKITRKYPAASHVNQYTRRI